MPDLRCIAGGSPVACTLRQKALRQAQGTGPMHGLRRVVCRRFALPRMRAPLLGKVGRTPRAVRSERPSHGAAPQGGGACGGPRAERRCLRRGISRTSRSTPPQCGHATGAVAISASTGSGGCPRKLKLAPVRGFRRREIARGAPHWLAPGLEVVTDGEDRVSPLRRSPPDQSWANVLATLSSRPVRSNGSPKASDSVD